MRKPLLKEELGSAGFFGEHKIGQRYEGELKILWPPRSLVSYQYGKELEDISFSSVKALDSAV